jgi:hypothetical protein
MFVRLQAVDKTFDLIYVKLLKDAQHGNVATAAIPTWKIGLGLQHGVDGVMKDPKESWPLNYKRLT